MTGDCGSALPVQGHEYPVCPRCNGVTASPFSVLTDGPEWIRLRLRCGTCRFEWMARRSCATAVYRH